MLSIVFSSSDKYQVWDIETTYLLRHWYSRVLGQIFNNKTDSEEGVFYITEQFGSEDQHLWNEAVLFQPLCYVMVLGFCLKQAQWKISLELGIISKNQRIVIIRMCDTDIPRQLLRFCLKQAQWNRFRIRWRYTVPL